MPRWTFENKVTLGNLIQILVVVVGLVWGYASLAGSVATSADAVKAIPSIDSRLTKVEINQINNTLARSEQTVKIDKLIDQNSLILQAVAGIVARMDAEKRK